MALKLGAAAEGATSSDLSAEGASIPLEAMEEMKRNFGFDDPSVVRRYLRWLGLWPKEVDGYTTDVGESRRISGNQTVTVLNKDGALIFQESGTNTFGDWKVIELELGDKGQERARIYKSSFSGILTGDFGNSFVYREDVLSVIKSRFPVSLQFGIMNLVLVFTICVYLGISKALEHGSLFDLVSSSLVFMAYSIPGWALGALTLVLFCGGSFLQIFPLGGFESVNYDQLPLWEKIIDRASYFVLPSIAYTLGGFASLTMLMKNSILETLGQDFIRTAYAKGLKENRVIWLHAMRNSIIPMVANIGYVIGLFMAGSYLVERVFNIDGIGKLSFQAILDRDYNIVFAFTVISVSVHLLGAIISDFFLAVVDPRIKFK